MNLRHSTSTSTPTSIQTPNSTLNSTLNSTRASAGARARSTAFGHTPTRWRAIAIAAGLAALASVLALSAASAAETSSDQAPRAPVVNINSASAEQLALLPRIGPSVAERILEHRKENGPFKSPNDLLLVRGIGDRTFELLRPYVAVSGETTLRSKVGSPRSASATSGKPQAGAGSGGGAKER